MEKLKGIDISEFNGKIDFKKVKEQVDFIYIRATFGRFGIDKKFHEYTKGCIENKIPFGFYCYSYAVTEEHAKEEALFFIKTIDKYKNDMCYPLMLDMEDADSYKKQNGNPSNYTLSKICEIFCEEIIKNKFSPIIYASADWFKNRLDSKILSKYMKWVAWWGADESKIDFEKYKIWQYSEKGKIDGISSKYVDMDYSVIDFKNLKEYINNINKINFIKSKTLFPDLTIQYLTCYKFGQELINRLFECLHNEPIAYEEIDLKSKLNKIQKYFKFENKTIEFLLYYIYCEDTINQLYNAISNHIIEVK